MKTQAALSQLLLDLAYWGSFAQERASFLLSTPEVDCLLAHDWIASASDDFYYLTNKAGLHISPGIMYGKPAFLGQYTASAAAALSEMSVVELIQRLAGMGWQDHESKAPARETPYGLNGEKKWYRAAPGRSYLQALAQADKVLQTTSQIAHGQMETTLGLGLEYFEL